MNFFDFLDSRLVTILSLIANFILAIIIFFKTALNEMLVEWWRDRKEKKEEEYQTYLNLRNNLKDLFHGTISLQISAQGSLYGGLSEENKKRSIDKWGKLWSDIENNEMKYNRKIREKIWEYIKLCRQQNAKIIDSDLPPQDLREFSEARKPIEDKVMEEVESEISKHQ
jgi:hypothetical protein